MQLKNLYSLIYNWQIVRYNIIEKLKTVVQTANFMGFLPLAEWSTIKFHVWPENFKHYDKIQYSGKQSDKVAKDKFWWDIQFLRPSQRFYALIKDIIVKQWGTNILRTGYDLFPLILFMIKDYRVVFTGVSFFFFPIIIILTHSSFFSTNFESLTLSKGNKVDTNGSRAHYKFMVHRASCMNMHKCLTLLNHDASHM